MRRFSSGIVRGGCQHVKFTAVGPSTLDAICHCSICRKEDASGLSFSAFLPHQVTFEGDITRTLPTGSKHPRLHCSSCSQYVGEDATARLGLVALPHAACESHAEPSHHIFSDGTSKDALAHWKTFPGGTCVSGSGGVDPNIANTQHLMSPVEVPKPREYFFTHVDPPKGHSTLVSEAKLKERVAFKYESPVHSGQTPKQEYDAVIIGAGHNGLTTACYLAAQGMSTVVLERRPLVGGACVTQEIVPGFQFSRGAYLAGLFRQNIIEELQLDFEYIVRPVHGFSPGNPSLLLSSDQEETHKSISQFSVRDADSYMEYERFLASARSLVEPLLDEGVIPSYSLASSVWSQRKELLPLSEFFSADCSFFLNRQFESEVLKAALATDAVIGAHYSPSSPGSAYVLLHHVMGEALGIKGVWAQVRGGMGAITQSLARRASTLGAQIMTNSAVDEILVSGGRASAVRLSDGTVINANKAVISNATPYHTYLELLKGHTTPSPFNTSQNFVDYSCSSFKLNLAVDKLPSFTCEPGAGPHLGATIHFTRSLTQLENAFRDASCGLPARRPLVEMTIPSYLDASLAPSGQHVVQLFVQYAPFRIDPKVGSWRDPAFKQAFVDTVIDVVEQEAPGFRDSIIGQDALSPLDLEWVFGLQGGSISHGALSLHQIGPNRCAHKSPVVDSLFLCGAGTHPGGGVQGAAGKLAAKAVLNKT